MPGGCSWVERWLGDRSDRTLDQYCRRHNLGINQRLRLFIVVCAAVQYAHQNLIVHRDLKPSNILVTENGQVKLLDFGIARALAHDPEADRLTRTDMHVMTPEYASPEQVRGEEITTASDVYSLGVMLYELLTGVRPYKLAGRTPGEIERIVCEMQPPHPSAAVGSRAGEPGQGNPAGSGEGQPERLRRRLSGDLDTIILKALHKDPARRYGSPGRLAEDLGRHLARLPVLARPDTPLYRASRFVRRHRVGAAAAALLALSLIAGIAGTTWQARRATRQARAAAEERDRARTEAQKAGQGNCFCTRCAFIRFYIPVNAGPFQQW